MRRVGRWIWRTALTGFLGAGILLVALEGYMRAPLSHPERVIDVRPGTSMGRVARQLEQMGVIRFYPALLLYGRLRGEDRRMKAGEYLFESGLTPHQVYTKLTTGAFRTFEIRLIEGWTYRQMARYLAQQSFITIPHFEAAFIAACEEPARVAKLGIAASSLEGFLFPNTYRLHRPRSAGEIVDLLTTEFQRQYTEAMGAQATTVGLSLLQAVTLASIIEKETGDPRERPLVSAVFHNRLQKGMKLETDPTVVYGIPQYDGVIHRSDLANPHPYNTYVHQGLPPGPIANPGRASLEAAINPAPVRYLYFVSRNDGTHVFSEDFRDHANAVQEYQR
ncbi:MAG: endolytic transglycosylase MltG [Deltaproteobacteria bacterium]|nr:endolytic transglycosylase MltG [Deltaproteobacteria bacterium]